VTHSDRELAILKQADDELNLASSEGYQSPALRRSASSSLVVKIFVIIRI